MARCGGYITAFCLVLMLASVATVPLIADEPATAELSEELLAKARELVKGWDRPAPRIEFAEKWRVSLPIGEFAPVVWAAESDRLAVLSNESEVLVLDANDGRELARFKGKAEDRSDCREAKGSPRCIAISPDGEHVAIGCTDGVLIWNWSDDKVEFVHNAAKNGVAEVCISGDGQYVYFADQLHNVGCFPLLGGMGWHSGFLSPLDAHVVDLAINYDGTRLLGRSSRTRPFFELFFDENRSPEKFPKNTIVGIEGLRCIVAGKTLRVAGGHEGGLIVLEAPPYEDEPGWHWNSTTGPIEHLHRVYLSRDEQLAMGTSTGGDVAVRHTHGQEALWLGMIPDVRIRAVQSDFRALVATGRKPGELIRFDMKPLASHPAREMEVWMVDTISRKAFDEIDAVFAVLADDPKVFPAIPYQSRFAALADAIVGARVRTDDRKRFEEARNEWLATRSHRPGAAFAVAVKKVAAAWDARGGGFAITVTPQGYEEFHKQLMGTNEILEPFFNGDKPPPLDLYVPWFNVGMGASWPAPMMKLQVKQLLERIDRWHPACDSVALMLLPRWHGEPEDAHKFATAVETKLGGEAGQAAYARIAVGLSYYHGRGVWTQNAPQPGNAPAPPTLGFDFPKTKAGLLHILEKEDAFVGSQFLKQVLSIAEGSFDDELTAAVLRRKDRRLRGE